MRGQLEARRHTMGQCIAGVDEVGRGCIAGPVHAACVILDYDKLYQLDADTRDLIRDSKQLSHDQRAHITPVIKDIAIAHAVASSSPRVIERVGIAPATFTAMRKAIRACKQVIDIVFVDGNCKIAGYHGEQETVIKGDSLCYCIAAASILAKEARDSYMAGQAKTYPGYGFESHVGYGTKQHLEMIDKQGICDLHRRNFAPIFKYVEATPLF